MRRSFLIPAPGVARVKAEDLGGAAGVALGSPNRGFFIDPASRRVTLTARCIPSASHSLRRPREGEARGRYCISDTFPSRV